MNAAKQVRPLGVNLTLVGLVAIVVGSLVYTVLGGIGYLLVAVNLLGLALALFALPGLFLMKRAGAALTLIAAAFNMSAQMFNFQNAYLYYQDFAPLDYITGVVIPVIAFTIGCAVLVYIFRQVFANKFETGKTEDREKGLQGKSTIYLAIIINLSFIVYQLIWAFLDQSINAFNAVTLILAVISIAALVLLGKWKEAITEFTAVLFLFRIVQDLQWTANSGLTYYSSTIVAVLLAMEGLEIALASVQIGYVFSRIFRKLETSEAAASAHATSAIKEKIRNRTAIKRECG